LGGMGVWMQLKTWCPWTRMAFYLSILGLLDLMFTCSSMNLNFADHDTSNRKGII